MPTRLGLPALTVVVALACVPRGGNDESLTPVLHPGPRGTYAVSSVAGTQVAVFEVESSDDGWSLRYLGARDGGGVLSYEMQDQGRLVSPSSFIPMTQMIYFGDAAVMNGCSFGEPRLGNAFGIGASPCPEFLFSAGPPLGTFPEDENVVFISSTEHLTDAQWEAIADSLPGVGRLLSIPDRLGRRAFASAGGARWEATLESLQPMSRQQRTAVLTYESRPAAARH